MEVRKWWVRFAFGCLQYPTTDGNIFNKSGAVLCIYSIKLTCMECCLVQCNTCQFHGEYTTVVGIYPSSRMSISWESLGPGYPLSSLFSLWPEWFLKVVLPDSDKCLLMSLPVAFVRRPIMWGPCTSIVRSQISPADQQYVPQSPEDSESACTWSLISHPVLLHYICVHYLATAWLVITVICLLVSGLHRLANCFRWSFKGTATPSHWEPIQTYCDDLGLDWLRRLIHSSYACISWAKAMEKYGSKALIWLLWGLIKGLYWPPGWFLWQFALVL